MRALAWLILAGAALSVLKAAITALVLALALMTLWGVLFRPTEVMRFGVFVLCWWLLQNNPWFAAALVVIGVLPRLSRRASPSSRSPSETHFRQN